jgi:predicted type IV restriction endonuclease
VTENELKHAVLRVARLNGWAVYSPAQNRVVRPDKGGSSGYPDLTCARDKEVLFIELKQDGGMQTSDQYAWELALPAYHVIRPKDLDAGRVHELLA